MLAFVIMRNQVTYAQQCVQALEDAGLDVVIVDHGSTWPAALDWLDGIAERESDYGGYPKVLMNENHHPRDLWRPLGPLDVMLSPRGRDTRFVVTDCDVVPDKGCPTFRWVDAMSAMLDANPRMLKVGLGLRTDDLPAHYVHRRRVIDWEARWQAVADGGRASHTVSDGAGVVADIDTTLAMYRRYEPFALGPAVRMRAPFLARHLPWYEDSSDPTPEQVYYFEHAEYGHWRDPQEYADIHHLGDGT